MKVGWVKVKGIGAITEVCDWCRAPIGPASWKGRGDRSYCSQLHRDLGDKVMKEKKNPKFAGMVNQPVCDHCGKPIKVVAFRGQAGRYCSNECYRAAEAAGVTKTKDEKETAMAKKTKVKVATVAKKKVAKKKVAKKKVASTGEKAATPKAGKKVAKEEKAATPKAEKKTASKKEGALFRAGSTKAKIYEKFLAAGEPASVSEIQAFIEEEGKTPALFSFVLKRLKERGFTVTRDRAKKTVQVTS